MAQLKELYEELNFPSKTKLLQAAKKRGIPIAGMDVLYKEQPIGQLFGKAPAQRGAIATAGEHDKWQADLISLKQYSRKQNSGYTDALSVTNVFDRKTHVLPVKSKEQKVVWEAFEQILTKFGGAPRRLDVDAATEFTGAFAEQARAKGIEIHTRSANPPDKDFLAVGDAGFIKTQSWTRYGRQEFGRMGGQAGKGRKGLQQHGQFDRSLRCCPE
jgi:hypothetical protein